MLKIKHRIASKRMIVLSRM